MFLIGDFSKLSRVPVKTLRYYDEIGLFKPMKVDHFTGYRYYSASQLPRLNRILALRDLGFTLEQIAQLLDEELPLAQLQGMFRLRQAELQQQLIQGRLRLMQVEARLRQIEQENTMPTYDVVVKQIAPLLVASIRTVIPGYDEVGPLFDELDSYLQRSNNEGLDLALWHDEGYKERDIDAEAAVTLKQRIAETERIKVHELPAATVASLVHHGAYNTIGQAYDTLLKWIEVNGYEIDGPNRELYLHCGEPVRQDDASYITEIQFPISKA
ncbi:MerR family transcriptional regulator [Ktedonosporobacter rubrisoli]|uniref:MerR family transcriptional regulator n=1 Tax=Ktedonosporobacter rubrisoli TaxID=2509675 RepID=A0A4P6JKY6_KTERU|nr:MerR family transcriptional regulator [Ktedonosporobacter rubrisoli]QBD75834.1 MerR family transcriptional regulator [Ktedonosporobacter rubrisoli]